MAGSEIGVSRTRSGAELLEQILGDAIGAAIEADFLAHDDHIGILGHRIGQRLAQRVAVSQLRLLIRLRARVDAGTDGLGLRLGWVEDVAEHGSERRHRRLK